MTRTPFAAVRQWRNVSISGKLYFAAGLMAVLIVLELLTLRFAMKNLSAARAFVGGEGLWSKAQKNAVLSLEVYGRTHDEKDYQAFLDDLKVPAGDHVARTELMKPKPDFDVVRRGFEQGQIHPKDIPAVIELLRRFYWVSYISRAIGIWSRGDDLLQQLKAEGQSFHKAVLENSAHAQVTSLRRLIQINAELTGLEDQFSYTLGEGSRWLEYIVLSVLSAAVIAVESIGLSLVFVTSRRLSRGLFELRTAAERIGQGQFGEKVFVDSADEIGQMGVAINNMGELLSASYSDLEKRVRDRTIELEKVAGENEKLYKEAAEALRTRDEFLSVASHELKTPITALSLQLQMLEKIAEKLPPGSQGNDVRRHSGTVVKLLTRTTRLLDELLDLTRLRLGKFEIHRAPTDLAQVVRDVVAQLAPEATRAGSLLTVSAPGPVRGNVDSMRMAQLVTNLISNAIKYGEGKPIRVSLAGQNGAAQLMVEDQGVGIPSEKQKKIFERYERVESDTNISGLGLGLYISKEIVDAHGGDISVNSQSGRGSTFKARIPLS